MAEITHSAAETTALMDAAYERGQRAVLAEVAKLPSPVYLEGCEGYTAGSTLVTGQCCKWCGLSFDPYAENHPDTDCLWPRALAVTQEG